MKEIGLVEVLQYMREERARYSKLCDECNSKNDTIGLMEADKRFTEIGNAQTEIYTAINDLSPDEDEEEEIA